MTRTIAMGAIFAATVLIAVAYASALVTGGVAPWAPWLLMIGTAVVMIATMVLGAARGRGGVGPLAIPFAGIFLLLVIGFGTALLMPAESADSPLWFGLPPRAAVVLYGIGILPLFVLPLAYARTFESLTLSESDLERIRQAKAARLGRP